MNDTEPRDSSETIVLLERARAGDSTGLEELLSRHRDRLHRMVHLRLSPAIRGRVDASDVIQEAFLEASNRLADYLRDPSMPFFLWLRFITRQRMLTLHRRHLGTQARDPRREVSIYGGALPEATSDALAAQLLGQTSTPSMAAMRAELQVQLQDALNRLEPLEREVLALRHFEQLSNSETAQELGIAESAASKRYVRALTRLRGILIHLNLDGSR